MGDFGQAGRELGAQFVLSGNVRKVAERLRISAWLMDTATETQIWAERFETEADELFAIQDRIAERVIGSIEPYLFGAQALRSRSKAPESLDAWSYVMRAMPHIWTWSAGDNQTAVAYLEEAAKIDPSYARANALLSWVHAQRLNIGWGVRNEVHATSLRLAQIAIHQDPEDAWAHLALGYIHAMTRRFEEAVSELTTTLSLNPSFAFAHAMLGMAYAYAGVHDQGLQQCQLALRLSPHDPQQAPYLSTIGLCHFMARRLPEAAEFQRRCVEVRPHFGSAWRTLAATAGLCGDHELAAAALRQAKQIQPELTIKWIEEYHPILHQADRSLYIEGLKIAGLR
jgi:adenylate cyclase